MSTDTAARNTDPAVRLFHVDIAKEAIVDLRRRVAVWRPPEREPVDDQSHGVQLATVQDLANYWATDYDWRRCEAKLNALPQFKIEIDGLDIHFIHVRSPQQNALPLIVTHGWPGSVIEQLKIIEPLTNPTEHGGTAEDAFDVVISSLPGYGFSGKPAVTGWDPETAAQRAIGSSSTSGAIIRSAAGPAAAKDGALGGRQASRVVNFAARIDTQPHP
jgi:Epoxide hydrolase N terminus